MYERILVALDGSQRSEGILPYVEELARKEGSRVTLLHVVTPTAPGGAGVFDASLGVPGAAPRLEPLQEEGRREQAQQYLARVMEQLRDRGLAVEAVVGEGDAATQIVAYAQQIGAGLIALCTHGHTGVAHILLGSVTESVLRHTVAPLLLVRNP